MTAIVSSLSLTASRNVDRSLEAIVNDAARPLASLSVAAIRKGNYRLPGTTMYSTIEPCAMCAGALVNARVERLVFGAHDERFGAVESVFRVCDSPDLNHRIEITSGILADKCRALMQDFFRSRRSGTKL